MPAPKKVWIADGSIERYPSAFHEGSIHGGLSCETCHGGDATADNRDAAHAGSFQAVPLAGTCADCHTTVSSLTHDALHTTLRGYEVALAERGVDLDSAVMDQRYDEQCTKCHTARDNVGGVAESACGHCHVSVPSTAGGGFLAGHRFQRTPSMQNNCTACHGSRVKDEYEGLNGALLARNRAALPESSPWADESFVLEADVHQKQGFECVDCHASPELHGVRSAVDGGRYEGQMGPLCEDCHGGDDDTAFDSVTEHMSAHTESMSCQVCHAQPYKNCFSCHTDVTDEGLAYYRINEAAPYFDPHGTAPPDALMTFRIGMNPGYTPDSGEKKFVVLRHVPIDRDTFRYSGANEMEGLIPDMAARPTWLPATPHTIARNTPVTESCGNCHDEEAAEAFWLIDAVANAYGWIAPEYEDDEADANEPVVVPQNE